MQTIQVNYLEMTSPHQLRAKPDTHELIVAEVELATFQLNRFLYELVGEAWQWRDKLSWTDKQWQDWVEQESLRTWIAYHRGSPAGFFELHFQGRGQLELAYFGVAPGFIGRGFGGQLISHAVQSAWSWQGVERVWLHTCSLDHPNALKNHLARGFELYKSETKEVKE